MPLMHILMRMPLRADMHTLGHSVMRAPRRLGSQEHLIIGVFLFQILDGSDLLLQRAHVVDACLHITALVRNHWMLRPLADVHQRRLQSFVPAIHLLSELVDLAIFAVLRQACSTRAPILSPDTNYPQRPAVLTAHTIRTIHPHQFKFSLALRHTPL